MSVTRVDGVTFVTAECLKMSRAEFVRRHLRLFWPDRDEAARRKTLTKAYDLMAARENKQQ